MGMPFVYAEPPKAAKQTNNSPQPSINYLTLPAAYQLALKQSEIIAIDAEVIKEAEGRFLQAFSTILPHVSYSVTQFWKDPSSVVSSTSSGNGSDRKFVFTQTLFSGFKEFAAMKGSKSEHSQRVYEKARAEELLYSDVADAFYLFVEQREDRAVLESVRLILKRRLQDLQKRMDIGRSRRSEVVNTEAQLYQVEANIESSKSQLALARQLLEFLIGKPFVDVSDENSENIFLLSLKPESDYTLRAEARTDVLASQKAWDVADKTVAVARSGYFPTVTLEDDYYTHRDTPPKDQDWNAQIQVNIPIFDGLLTYGQVKEARAKAKESELFYDRTRRSAVQDIRNAYVDLDASLSQTKALKRALDAYEMNYTLQEQDYSFNLITNLDVLTAIQNLQDVRRNYIHTFYEAKRFYWQLRVATGDIHTEVSHGSI